MNGLMSHLPVLPIVLPLLVGAGMLLLGDKRRPLKAVINFGATLALLVLAVLLLIQVDAGGGTIEVYVAANWQAPFGIVLVADRLSALMLVLTSVLALASLVFAIARWDKAGVHFHPLFQFLLMGLNGAFLTGDLFNLFVFFEVMLTASYGLVMHGSGWARVKAGMHYIVINLAASALFLIGVSLIYGVTGTLNMADLAAKIPEVADSERMLMQAGAAILGVAFLVKGAMWPLNFWLPPAYGAASPPVAAIFAIMSKVGVYAVIRLWLLLFGHDAGASSQFGGNLLLYGGLATIAFGAIGMLASQELPRLAGFSIIISSGTLLAAVSFGQPGVTSGALYYMLVSTLAIAAFFLLIELVERTQSFGANMLALTMEAFEAEGAIEEAEVDEVGVAIPMSMAFLGLAFVCCALLMTGLPPLAGFLAKFAILTAAINPAGVGGSAELGVSSATWALVALVILSGLAGVIALSRAGIRTFWAPADLVQPRLRVLEVAPIAGLLLVCVGLTIQGGPVMRYLEDTAAGLHAPTTYIDAVLTAPQVPSPYTGGQP